MDQENQATGKSSSFATATRVGAILLFLAVFIVAFTQFRETISLQNLAQHEASLRQWQNAHPILVYGAAFLIYVAVTGFSLPGATVLTLVFGWYFGLGSGILLVSFASTTGASVAFLLSRFIFRDAIQKRFGKRLASFNTSLEKEGPFYLFTLRLIPAVPFFVINAVMGLTPIRIGTFWWISQIGMLPATIIYVYAGSRVPNIQTLADKGIQSVFSPAQLSQIIIALALLGIFPLLVRYIVKFLPKPTSV